MILISFYKKFVLKAGTAKTTNAPKREVNIKNRYNKPPTLKRKKEKGEGT